MRINDPPPPLTVTPPEYRGPIAGVVAASGVGTQRSSPAAPQPLPDANEAAQAARIVAERRRAGRRNQERRRRQAQVLIDTRVARRRTGRRRAADNAPAAVNVQA